MCINLAKKAFKSNSGLHLIQIKARGLFLESPGNLPGTVSVFSDKCKSIFVSFEY